MTVATAIHAYASGNWHVHTGNEDAFVARWTEFRDWARDTQPGSVSGTLMHDKGEPSHYVCLFKWQDLAALNAFLGHPDLGPKIGACMGLCDDTKSPTSHGRSRFGRGRTYTSARDAGQSEDVRMERHVLLDDPGYRELMALHACEWRVELGALPGCSVGDVVEIDIGAEDEYTFWKPDGVRVASLPIAATEEERDSLSGWVSLHNPRGGDQPDAVTQ